MHSLLQRELSHSLPSVSGAQHRVHRRLGARQVVAPRRVGHDRLQPVFARRWRGGRLMAGVLSTSRRLLQARLPLLQTLLVHFQRRGRPLLARTHRGATAAVTTAARQIAWRESAKGRDQKILETELETSTHSRFTHTRTHAQVTAVIFR